MFTRKFTWEGMDITLSECDVKGVGGKCSQFTFDETGHYFIDLTNPKNLTPTQAVEKLSKHCQSLKDEKARLDALDKQWDEFNAQQA